MTGINDLAHLKFSTDAIDVDMENLPSQGRVITPPPQPGMLRLRIPTGFAKALELYQTDKGQRLRVNFRDEFALIDLNHNQPYSTMLSNEERGFEDQPKSSALAFLLHEAFGVQLKLKATNKDYAEALLAQGGKEFAAFNDLGIVCKTTADIYRRGTKDSPGGRVEGLKGCGTIYKTFTPKNPGNRKFGLIPKDENGLFATEFECAEPCGALLRCFGNLSKFKAVE